MIDKIRQMSALALIGTLLAFPVSYAAAAEGSETGPYSINTDFVDVENNAIGKAVLTEGAKGVVISIDVEGLTPGWHAIHIHEKGDCSPVEPREDSEQGYFTNTGGHFNPDEHDHGIYSEGGTHVGDLPNIHAGADGTVKTDIFNDRVTLKEDADNGRAYLFDEDGSALIIHEGTDDYISQPTGAAGGRVACAVIYKP